MNVDPFADPLQFLSACHGRIRQRLFTFRLAAARLRAPGLLPRHELEAAVLFFRTSGEGHAEDEERSLFPRLRARLEPAGAALIDRLLAEHRVHDELFARVEEAMVRLDPSLGEGNGLPDPRRLEGGTAAAAELADALEALIDAYESHIPIEDDRLYPLAATLLPAAELAEVAAEMRGRRVLGRKLLG